MLYIYLIDLDTDMSYAAKDFLTHCRRTLTANAVVRSTSKSATNIPVSKPASAPAADHYITRRMEVLKADNVTQSLRQVRPKRRPMIKLQAPPTLA